MANLNKSRVLFFITSPRSPFKMVPEIELLAEKFSGKKWDVKTQEQFAKELSKAEFFKGKAKLDSAFSARDRINRAPKALGFVDLAPTIKLSEPGELLINGKRPHEVLTRQLLKFQLPSPYHIDNDKRFYVKPYLEILRLIYDLEFLTKDEIKIFALQITKYTEYEIIKKKIFEFRNALKNLDRKKTSYKRFVNEVFEVEISSIYENEIDKGQTETRESSDKSLKKFIATKKSNHRDYADACFRYLRATELITLSGKSLSLRISEDKLPEVEFILKNIDRKPINFSNVKQFKEYLFDPTLPSLATDDKVKLVEIVAKYNCDTNIDLHSLDIEKLKDLRDHLVEVKKEASINEQVETLKTYIEYEDILNIYDEIKAKNLVDLPLMMEWNTWRSFAMIGDGTIKGNFKVDDDGMPLSTAIGNLPDIDCKYDNFDLIVEVTLSSGQRQYEMEGEPVARHLAQLKKKTEKDAYCIFVAPTLSEATLAHFFILHKIDISFYNGNSKIIPMELSVFLDMLECAYMSKTKPTSQNIQKMLEHISEYALKSENEVEWYLEIKSITKKWIN